MPAPPLRADERAARAGIERPGTAPSVGRRDRGLDRGRECGIRVALASLRTRVDHFEADNLTEFILRSRLEFQ